MSSSNPASCVKSQTSPLSSTNSPGAASSARRTSCTSWSGDILPEIPYLRLTQDGTTWFTRTNNLDVYHPGVHVYTGYDWNSATGSSGTNCDNCGNNFSTGLSHRALLYWETSDSDYAADQWFHGQPLSLTDSTGPDNSVQDIGIFLREER